MTANANVILMPAATVSGRAVSRFRLRSLSYGGQVAPRNDDKSRHAFATPRRDAPESLMNLSPYGGRGECRVPSAPAVSCALVLVERTRVTTSTPESPGIPARNGFTAYFALSSVTGLFCHRRPRIWFACAR